jgi:hypothetical protein
MRHALLVVAALAGGCKSTRDSSPPPPPTAPAPGAPASAPGSTTPAPAAPASAPGSAAPAPASTPAPAAGSAAASAGGQVRTVSDFDQVQVSGAFDVDIADGSARAVEVTADPDVLSHVTTQVADHELAIGLDGDVQTHHPIHVHVATPNVARVHMSGASHVVLHGVHGGNLRIESSGAGDVTADGTAAQVAIDVSGAGTVHTKALTTERADVKVEGAAKVEVFASKALDVNVSGAAEVRYAGHPPQVNQHVSGAAHVEAE